MSSTKKWSKALAAFAVAALTTMALAMPAFGQTVALQPADSDNATITFENATKGETYAVYKLFDATVTGTKDGSIAYQGNIPSDLNAYFSKDSAGNISLTEAGGTSEAMSDALQAALKTWASSATATNSAVSDGSELSFTALPYGYYVVTSTQGDQAITVSSTNPNATIVDKNQSTPGFKDNQGKAVDDDDVKIGQTVKYTITYTATNYVGAGTNAAKVVSYKVVDTLPDFLTDVAITSVKVGDTTLDGTWAFDDDKKIIIPWVDNSGNHIYANNSVIEVAYSAKVTADAAIAGEGNTNTVTITPQSGANVDIPNSSDTASKTINTYAIAIKKVNDKGEALAGATFQFPFAVTEDGGVYTVDASAATQSATITTPADGVIVIKGVESGSYNVTETAAPNGYNALTAPVSVTAAVISETTTNETKYIDENGNVTGTETDTRVTYTNNDLAASTVFVVNKTGSLLPSTGGMGTTILYVVGGIMIVAAGLVLVVKRRLA